MTAASFDSNILIDSLRGDARAKTELKRFEQRWISRMSWIEVMSKVLPEEEAAMEAFFADFSIDEVTVPVSRRAARLRLQRPSLRTPDAVILASAQIHDRTLVTRNTRDFPADMPGVHIPYRI